MMQAKQQKPKAGRQPGDSVKSGIHLQDASGYAHGQCAVCAVAHGRVQIEVVGVERNAQPSVGRLLGRTVGDEDLAVLLLGRHS